MKDESSVHRIRSEIRNDKILNTLADQCQKEEKVISIEEFEEKEKTAWDTA